MNDTANGRGTPSPQRNSIILPPIKGASPSFKKMNKANKLTGINVLQLEGG